MKTFMVLLSRLTAIARVHPVYLMNVAQRTANLSTKTHG